MASKRLVADNDFGQIIIHTRRGARNITMRVKPDGLHLTVPPRSLLKKVLEVLQPYRKQLLEQFEQIAPKPVDLSFRIHADCFHLSLASSKLKHFTIRREEEEMIIYCPENVDFKREDVQKLVRSAILRAMKKAAETYLPPLLSMWAERFGLTYRKVRITGARSRWGSCSAARTISLSCYLMLLPVKLMDYVILHELAHTKEMNHGPRFWELLDGMTEGKALLLRKELRAYRTSF
ncbi:MAG: DUF45 domain-containing protein [Bacteroides sp.]|nr:DUF45 domain-containing protein [Bacteroides sp.]